jgi:hypothetical protein
VEGETLIRPEPAKIISASYGPLAVKSGETIHRRRHPTSIIPANRTTPNPTPKASDRGNVRGAPELHLDHFSELRAQPPALGGEIGRDDPPAPHPLDHSGEPDDPQSPRRRRLIGEMSKAAGNPTTIISASYEPSPPPLAVKSGETIHRRRHPTSIIPANRTTPNPTPKADRRKTKDRFFLNICMMTKTILSQTRDALAYHLAALGFTHFITLNFGLRSDVVPPEVEDEKVSITDRL